MDKQTFLESGLLEQYALGIIDPDEEEIVEEHLNLYPELREEVEEMRKAIHQYALQQNIPPIPKKTQPAGHHAETQLLAVNQATSHGKINWLNILVIGSLALLCTLSAWRMQNLQHENHELKGQLATCESREHIIAFLKDPQTQPVVLTNMQDQTQSAALIYWNKNSQKAMLNPFNLPRLPVDQQYQIWADVRGEMLSIGLVNQDLAKYQDLEFLENAVSLNITIEPKGGSATPTVSRLVASRGI